MNAIAQPSALPESGPQLDNRRVLAGLIDLVVVLAPAFLIGFAAGMSGAEFTEPSLALSAVTTAWALYYYFALESGGGQTLGKMVMKLRVVRVDGAPLQMGDAAIRTVLRIVDGMFFYLVGLVVMLATGRRRGRLGDLAAKTMVVSADGAAAGPPAPAAVAPASVAPASVPLVAPEAPVLASMEAPVAPAAPPVAPELKPCEPFAAVEPEVMVEPEPVAEPAPGSAVEPEPGFEAEPVFEPEPVAVEEPIIPPAFPVEPPAEPRPLEPAPLPPAAEHEPFDRPVPVPAPVDEQPPVEDDEPQVVVKSVETVSAIDLVMGVNEPADDDQPQDSQPDVR